MSIYCEPFAFIPLYYLFCICNYKFPLRYFRLPVRDDEILRCFPIGYQISISFYSDKFVEDFHLSKNSTVASEIVLIFIKFRTIVYCLYYKK